MLPGADHTSRLRRCTFHSRDDAAACGWAGTGAREGETVFRPCASPVPVLRAVKLEQICTAEPRPPNLHADDQKWRNNLPLLLQPHARPPGPDVEQRGRGEWGVAEIAYVFASVEVCGKSRMTV